MPIDRVKAHMCYTSTTLQSQFSIIDLNSEMKTKTRATTPNAIHNQIGRTP